MHCGFNLKRKQTKSTMFCPISYNALHIPAINNNPEFLWVKNNAEFEKKNQKRFKLILKTIFALTTKQFLFWNSLWNILIMYYFHYSALFSIHTNFWQQISVSFGMYSWDDVWLFDLEFLMFFCGIFLGIKVLNIIHTSKPRNQQGFYRYKNTHWWLIEIINWLIAQFNEWMNEWTDGWRDGWIDWWSLKTKQKNRKTVGAT